ncbi:MAG: polymorphic toxin type 44 domain-containing protein [Bacillota bacterium]
MNCRKIRFIMIALTAFLTSLLVQQQLLAGVGREDITKEFSDIMAKNAAYMVYYAQQDIKQKTYPYYTGKKFASKVRTGGDWDYKQKYGTKKLYTFNGKVLSGEDMGNMHYGFVGRSATFGKNLLLSAAGAYQIYSGTSYPGWWNSYFDDPLDQAWIKYGIDLWDNNSLPKSIKKNYGSASFDILTMEEKSSIEKEFAQDVSNNLEK